MVEVQWWALPGPGILALVIRSPENRAGAALRMFRILLEFFASEKVRTKTPSWNAQEAPGRYQ